MFSLSISRVQALPFRMGSIQELKVFSETKDIFLSLHYYNSFFFQEPQLDQNIARQPRREEKIVIDHEKVIDEISTVVISGAAKTHLICRWLSLHWKLKELAFVLRMSVCNGVANGQRK